MQRSFHFALHRILRSTARRGARLRTISTRASTATFAALPPTRTLQRHSLFHCSSAAMSTPESDRVVSLTNRCSESKSPYVRSHISNPTAWQLWNPTTLSLARRTNRLLFVSIGYSACHWCHVMSHESFDDPRIAQLLNEHFIPVKIDREERPDVDRQYMDFLQATTGGGGWPLNVFVTPDLEPVFGGTYWPGPKSERARLGGGASFEDVLLKVAGAWKEQEGKVRENGKKIIEQLREFAQEGNLGGRSGGKIEDDEKDGLELDLLEEGYNFYKGRFDRIYGGFGPAPKFPTPAHVRHLLRLGSYGEEVVDVVGEEDCKAAVDMAVLTLEAMAKGGIKDQIGHGFARYSVTRDWSVPHFEKMYVCDSYRDLVRQGTDIETGSTITLSCFRRISTHTSPLIRRVLMRSRHYFWRQLTTLQRT